jgi:hypothetical protein
MHPVLLLYVLATLWAWFGYNAVTNPRAIGSEPLLHTLLMSWGPLALLIFFTVLNLRLQSTRYRNLLKTAGNANGTGWNHHERDTGIAINPVARTVSLLSGSLIKTYAYADIRHWESQSHKAGRVIGIGLQAGMAAVGENARAARKAAEASGFFIEVRDVDHALWHIAMVAPALQARWMEIFRQEINEGGVKVPEQAPPSADAVNT